MDSATNIAKQGKRTVQAGIDAVTAATGKVPDMVRKVAAGDKTGTGTPPKYIVVEDLPDDVKESYLSVLVWFVHADDCQIDERELCEIQLLMTQLRCDAAVRTAVRSSLENPHSLVAQAQIDHILKHGAVESTDMALALKCSLMKDAIRVYRATSEGSACGQPRISRLADFLELEGKQVKFIEDACLQDEKILAGELSDSQIADVAKRMVAQATAVGVPVAAIYLSGSVAGLSAAGITSGLAALGLGGMLGLSAMVSGIGVAVIGGVAAYKGVQWALGGSKRNRASLREMMLQEVLRIHQRAIVNLGEDMSHFGRRVAALSEETEKNRDAIDSLWREVTLLSRSAEALSRLGERANGLEHDLREAAGQSES